ncbi:hypothetical protein [Thalassotalea marina]|uniref:Uncharacterized protein n=1 Tax=Thalassotalea marina TaxID=1673741 RepID=A0A919BS54_9GAMM|nr:hypothetical protein [Thalassotalea marina]GHG07157.1 hypothetical protein GCM10017161_41070 [Thalassotalea marina]
MTIFKKVEKKDWTIKVGSTQDLKTRYEAIQQQLGSQSSGLCFSIEDQLEEQVKLIITKAEKELKKLNCATANMTKEAIVND